MNAADAVLVQRDGPVALLSFNRPERLNAWGSDLSEPMLEALEALRLDEDVRAVVITGEGRAFCAGANLKRPGRGDSPTDPSGMPTRPAWKRRDIDEAGHPVFDALSHYPKPLIAAVNGYAIGIGSLIPVCCSFAIAGEDAVFSLPQVRLDILPAYGGTLRLARFVGRGHALHMAITGRRVGAREALEMGLVVAVHPPERLREEAIALARDAARAPAAAARLTQESLDLGYESGLEATAQADLLRESALRAELAIEE
ncbi:MAG: enoyl-CoA hydratase/isomerase family protein [Chloroflexi bacterium]|nr:enoyl-CoA hydratase/isomerase family protein [Chloroflexota bacterium]